MGRSAAEHPASCAKTTLAVQIGQCSLFLVIRKAENVDQFDLSVLFVVAPEDNPILVKDGLRFVSLPFFSVSGSDFL